MNEIVEAVRAKLVFNAREDVIAYREFVIKDDRNIGNGIKREPIHRAWVRHIEECRAKGKHCAIIAPWGHGKQLADDTAILTKDGWKTHGELIVGDYVYGRNGEPRKVIGISPKSVAEYKITFCDGTEIVAHARHEWIVFDRNKKREIIIESEQLYNTIGFRRTRYLIDHNVPVENAERTLPMHPYALGVWLGNGRSIAFDVTHDKKDIDVVNKIESLGYKKTATWIHKKTGVYTSNFGNDHALIKKSGLINNKHIPEIYFISSIKQRLDLLAGLIDTDGHVDKQSCRGRGSVRFTNTNKRLIDDVERLVISLGCRVSIHKQKACISSSGIIGRKDVYTVKFIPVLDIPTVLKRKKVNKIAQHKKRSIIKVEKVKGETGNCIEVDGGIYLAGKTLIPTHNSTQVAIAESLRMIGENKNIRIKIVCCADTFATDRVKVLKNYIDNDEDFQAVYPDIQSDDGQQWTQHRIYVQRDSQAIDPTIEARGILSKGVSGRADVLIFDDPVDDESIYSEPVRDSTRRAYQNVWMSRLVDTGFVLYIATRWADEDLTKTIMESGRYGILTQRVSEDFECIEQELGGIEYAYEKTLPLSTMWSKDRLIARRDEIGSAAFDRGYRQKAIIEGEILFPHFLKCMKTGLPPVSTDIEKIQYFAGVDLSGKEREGNVIAVVGRLTNGRKFLAHIIDGKWSSPETADNIKAVYDKYKPHVIHVENNAYQMAIIDWMKQKGITDTLPIMPFTTGKNKMDSAIGLPALDVQFEQGQWDIWVPVHPAGCICATCSTVREFKAYPGSSTSDHIMGLWLAERACTLYGSSAPAFSDPIKQNEKTKQAVVGTANGIRGIARQQW